MISSLVGGSRVARDLVAPSLLSLFLRFVFLFFSYSFWLTLLLHVDLFLGFIARARPSQPLFPQISSFLTDCHGGIG